MLFVLDKPSDPALAVGDLVLDAPEKRFEEVAGLTSLTTTALVERDSRFVADLPAGGADVQGPAQSAGSSVSDAPDKRLEEVAGPPGGAAALSTTALLAGGADQEDAGEYTDSGGKVPRDLPSGGDRSATAGNVIFT